MRKKPYDYNLRDGFKDVAAATLSMDRTGRGHRLNPNHLTECRLSPCELYHGLTGWVDNKIGKILAALHAIPEMAEKKL